MRGSVCSQQSARPCCCVMFLPVQAGERKKEREGGRGHCSTTQTNVEMWMRIGRGDGVNGWEGWGKVRVEGGEGKGIRSQYDNESLIKMKRREFAGGS